MKWTDKYKQVIATRFAPIKVGEYHPLPGRLVVSLACDPSRLHTLGLTLRSLLAQDVFPDLLVLWVAYDDFEHLPRSVMRLQHHGLVIKQCPDVRQHKKTLPSLVVYPRAFVATAEDNVYYPPDWLRQLVEAYRHPREILCRSARRMRRAGPGYLSFSDWEWLCEDGETGPQVFFTGAGGVLYPPGALAQLATDEDLFMRLCPGNADIWLNWMARLGGSSIRLVAPVDLMTWPDHLRGTRRRTSIQQDDVDRQIAAMVEAYGTPEGRDAGGLTDRQCAAGRATVVEVSSRSTAGEGRLPAPDLASEKYAQPPSPRV